MAKVTRALEGSRRLSNTEKRLCFDLSNMGMPIDSIATFFGMTPSTIYKYVLDERKTGTDNYTLGEMSRIMTEYLLRSLAKSMHKMSPEQHLRFLPDLLKVKDEQVLDNSEEQTHIYIPTKSPYEQEHLEKLGGTSETKDSEAPLAGMFPTSD